ncbi:hypothetical protein [Sodalis-like endosymbiont of Proechinophthirus fluctus]|nr:hypothetical protein [Sodalis-like endosymbiont of Proechinophthirus fluctus]
MIKGQIQAKLLLHVFKRGRIRQSADTTATTGWFGRTGQIMKE